MNKKLIVFFIILLMASHQFAISVYLPSIPHMVAAFKTTNSAIQTTITLYTIGFGISLFIYGPLSDHFGRRRILIVGLSIFIIGTVLAVMTHSAYILLFARLLQGLGLGSGDVMGRAILCDIYDEKGFLRAASYISMAAPITPIVAPILGGYMEYLFNWRANFILMLIFGIINLLLIYKWLPETSKLRNPEAQEARSLKELINYMLTNGLVIIKNPIFLGFFVPGLAAAVGDISYSLIGPFIIQNTLGWTPVEYGWLAIITASGIFIGAMISHRLSHKLTTDAIVLCGLITLLIGGVLMSIFSLLNYLSILTIVLPMMIFLAGAGIVYPSTNAGALSPFAHIAGIVGAIQGGLQTTLTGGIGMLAASANMQSQGLLAAILTGVSLLAIFIFLTLAYKKRSILQ